MKKKHFLQCILFDEGDVLELITAIKLIQKDEKTKEFKTNITQGTTEIYNKITGEGASFKYICKKCLETEGKTKETMKTLKKKLNKTENDLKTTKNKLDNEIQIPNVKYQTSRFQAQVHFGNST